MRRDEFLRQLEYLLQDIPDADRDDAISYYRDYLDEAGPENEAEVLRGFGSPERIASIIRSNLNGNLEDGGSFTEKGYEDERFRDPNYQLAKRMDLPEEWSAESEDRTQSERKTKPWTSGWLKIILCVILLAVASPLLLGVGGSVFGVLVAAVVVVVVLLLLAGILTLVALFTGGALIVSGFAALMHETVAAVFIIGLGLLLVGIGLLALLVSIWFYGKMIPWGFRKIGKGIDYVSDRIRRH
ncbi:MAG: hypothetical protein E7246_01270 [Lachnoclostridium sp.]|nr:hypothetical protein [Lachnoclostridium sp.]